MATSCEAIQERLVEVGGSAERLSEDERRHLERCPGCTELAAAERALGSILSNVLPPADLEMEERVRFAVRSSRRRRRLVALIPVAASLFVALLGAVLLGGLPGGSLLALLPVWSSQGWISLAATAGDWSAVLRTAAGATQAFLSPALVGTAVVVSMVGIAAIVTAARRWRRVSPWRDPD